MAVSVLILAGQREGVVDPLCADAGIKRKAIIPINGKPMLTYVLDALDGVDLERPYHVSGFDADYDDRLVQSPSGQGPVDSVLKAMDEGIPYPVLITTADHPLLTADMIEVFLNGAVTSGDDFCVGLATKETIQPAYPDVKRTYLKFNDRSVSGCNLFYLANAEGLKAIRFWREAQHLRKQPLKLASRLGWGILWRYITGRLSLNGAFDHVAHKLDLRASPVLIPIPEAAIDVDKPSDKILVERFLSERGS